MPRRLPALLLLIALLGAPPEATAEGVWKPGLYRLPLEGRIRDVRAMPRRDGKGVDLVVLTEPAPGTGGIEKLYLLRMPQKPVPRRLFPKANVEHMLLNGDLANAGAVAVGRFGPGGQWRLRFLTPTGIVERNGGRKPLPPNPRFAAPTLLGRSPGRRMVFWDGVEDLDRDGLDELLVPMAQGEGHYRVFGGTPAMDATLTLHAKSTATFDSEHQLARHARVAKLLPTDLDGDGRKELVTLQDTSLLVFELGGPHTGLLPARWRIHLPFLEPPKDLPPATLHTPRVQLEDMDGDGTTDMLVTLISGRRDRIGSLRTTLFHYPGPIVDRETGKLVAPRARIDTESVALHPTFVDLDGDGARDYIGDSLRVKNIVELAKLHSGEHPDIHHVGFRFDKRTGTFAGTPWFTTKRAYPRSETMSNRFGRTASFEGDFDGDGTADLLDLGNLGSVSVLRGVRRARGEAGDPLHFDTPLLHPVPVREGLRPGPLVLDLDGNHLDDAVLWSRDALYVLLSRKGT